MSKIGRGLLSLATGGGIWFGLFGVLLFARSLRAPDWVSTLILWILAWPLMLLAHFVHIPNARSMRMAMIAFSIGLLVDVGILSTITYCVLSVFNRKQSQSSPPSPPSFE